MVQPPVVVLRSKSDFLIRLQSSCQSVHSEHFKFLSTVYHSGRLDEYEAQVLYTYLSDEFPCDRFPGVLMPFSAYARIVKALKEESEGLDAIHSAASYHEVLLWEDQEIPAVPMSIATKAERLLQAAKTLSNP